MSEVFSILFHNRQRYEQGKEGLWFSLPTTTEKLQEALREIGIFRSFSKIPIEFLFGKKKQKYCIIDSYRGD